jgi:hypothetical protein
MIDRIRRQIDDLLEFLTSGPSVPPPPVRSTPQMVEFDPRLVPATAQAAVIRNLAGLGGTPPTQTLVTPFGAGYTGGLAVAAADLNGDGVPETIVAQADGPLQLAVFDGATNGSLGTVAVSDPRFGGSVGAVVGTASVVNLAAGDVNGDGVPDVVLGSAPGNDPRVAVFDGKALLAGKATPLIPDFPVLDTSYRFGVRPAVGDVNGDGMGDVVAASAPGDPPRLQAFSGAALVGGNISPFADLLPFGKNAGTGGLNVAVGDLTGDGKAEIVVGGGAGVGPRVRVLDGAGAANGQQLVRADFFAGSPAERTGATVAVGDPGTGKPAVIAGTQGKVTAFDAATQAQLGSSQPFAGRTNLVSVAAAGTGANSRVVAGPLLARPGTPTAPSRVVAQAGAAGSVNVFVSDPDQSPATLVVTATTSDPTLLTGLTVGGTGASRTVNFTAANRAGSATVTVTVTDADGQQVSATFTVSVLPAGPAAGLTQALTPGNLVSAFDDSSFDSTNPYSTPTSSTGVAEVAVPTGADVQSSIFRLFNPGQFDQIEGGIAIRDGVEYFALSRPGRQGVAVTPTNPYGSAAADDQSVIFRFDPATNQLTQLAQFNRESHGLAFAPDGSLVNAFFDGTYSATTNPYPSGQPDAATIGLSRIDPTTGAETVLFQRPVTAAEFATDQSLRAGTNLYTGAGTFTLNQNQPDFLPRPGGVAALPNGQILFTETRPGDPAGNGTNPYAGGTDDFSALFRFDPAAGAVTQLATRNHESHGLALAPDGSVVELFYDGTYTSNPYGPVAADIGVSRLDPTTGAETRLDVFNVPDLPLQSSFTNTSSTNPYDPSLAGSIPGGVAVLPDGRVAYDVVQPAPAQANAIRHSNATVTRLFDPATRTANPQFAFSLRESLGLVTVPTPATTAPDQYQAKAGVPLVVPAAQGLVANDVGRNGFPVRAVLVAPPPTTAGAVTVNPDGSFTFTPAAGFTGTTTFTYAATDGLSTSAPVTVTVTVGNNRTRLIAVGAGAGGGPRVKVFNQDGSLRFDFFAYEEQFRGGVRVAVGDLNGDGVDDIVAGAGTDGGPRVAVFDGVTGKSMGTFFAYESDFRGGVHVAVGDVDGDGKAEIITGAGSTGGPRVNVFDGTTFAPRLSFFAFGTDGIGGVRVSAGDLDGDGQDEIVAAEGPSGDADVRVFDGVTAQQLFDFQAFDRGYRAGLFVGVVPTDGVNPAEVVVSRDTVPDYSGSILENVIPGLPTSSVVSDPEVRVFDFPITPSPSGGAGTLSGPPTLRGATEAFPANFTGGVRVSGGPVATPGSPGQYTFLAAAGEGGGSAVRQFRFQGGVANPLGDLNASFGTDFLGGVYVAASNR